MNSADIKEIGLYIHIPFCKRKCYYCDFLSYSNKNNLIEKYCDTLIQEYRSYNMTSNYKIKTIYIGGGTPSYIDSKLICKILDEINKIDAKEITIEVNPGTVTKEKLQNYYNAGINRLSIGLQSTDNSILKSIGRIHTYEEFKETFSLARQIGFKNINVDLMLGLPGQTIESLKKSVYDVIGLKPEHISLYSLIIEEGTVLFNKVNSGELKLPDDDIERQMYWDTKKILEQNDYTHYEISNFCKSGFESNHNLDCWNQKEYIGIGAGAHSYINLKRYSNIDNIEKYIENYNNKKIHETQDKISEEKEYMLLGLRKIKGVSISEFKRKFIDNPCYIFRKELNKLSELKLIETDLDMIRLTSNGLDLANIVWEEFI